MLHERVRDKDEVSGDPASKRDGNGSGKMPARSEPFLAPDQCADERALQEEREHPFHRQRLSDHGAGVFGKIRPVRSELELHRNAGHDTDRKIESENLGPEPNRPIVFFVPSSKGAPFPVNDEPREPHRERSEERRVGKEWRSAYEASKCKEKCSVV